MLWRGGWCRESWGREGEGRESSCEPVIQEGPNFTQQPGAHGVPMVLPVVLLRGKNILNNYLDVVIYYQISKFKSTPRNSHNSLFRSHLLSASNKVTPSLHSVIHPCLHLSHCYVCSILMFQTHNDLLDCTVEHR